MPDVFGYVADAEAFINELRAIDNLNDRDVKIFKDQKFIVTLKEIRDLGQIYQYERLLEEIGKLFHNKKSNVRKKIESSVTLLDKQELQKKAKGFTAVDINSLQSKNGLLLPTPYNFEQVLLAANKTKFVFDTMMSKAFLTSMDWEPLTECFELPVLSGGIDRYYYYDDTNKAKLQIELNKSVFPTEQRFESLGKAVLVVSQVNKIDLYQKWMDYAKGTWDGIDRINGDNCYAVKYLGARDEQWSYSWARVFAINLVARCYDPGVPTRYIFVLEGEQNIGKTRWCSSLIPKIWYRSTSFAEFKDNSVEFQRATFDKGVVELAELGGTDKVSINIQKRVSTESESSFRRMRADDVIDYAKRYVLIMTTNEYFYGRDPTGATRFAPLRSMNKQNEFLDIAGFVDDWPQILAQAIHLYENGGEPHFDEEERILQKKETEKRDMSYETPEYDIIEHYFSDPLKLEQAKEDGIFLDVIYEFMFEKYEIHKNIAMLKKRQLAAAIIKYGFVIHSNKAVWNAEYKKPVKMWYWPKSS